jgi:hypothetical protein
VGLVNQTFDKQVNETIAPIARKTPGHSPSRKSVSAYEWHRSSGGINRIGDLVGKFVSMNNAISSGLSGQREPSLMRQDTWHCGWNLSDRSTSCGRPEWATPEAHTNDRSMGGWLNDVPSVLKKGRLWICQFSDLTVRFACKHCA